MQEANEPAGVADGLLEPHDGLTGAGTGVGGEGGIFGTAERLVGWGDREDEKEGVGRAGQEGQEGGLGQRVDVMIREGRREAKLVD